MIWDNPPTPRTPYERRRTAGDLGQPVMFSYNYLMNIFETKFSIKVPGSNWSPVKKQKIHQNESDLGLKTQFFLVLGNQHRIAGDGRFC